MAQRIWFPALEKTTPNFGVINSGYGVKLHKQRNSLGSAWGKYPVEGVTTTYKSFSAENVVGVLGFKADVVYPQAGKDYIQSGIYKGDYLGSVEFQVKINGSGWLYWDGSSFVTAGANDWNTDTEMSIGLSQMNSFTTIQFRSLMKPQLEQVPTLKSFGLFFNLRYNFEEDIYRTLRRWIVDRIMALSYYQVQLDTATDAVTIDHHLEVRSVIAAYNLTVDPEKSNDILQSASGSDVTLTSQQSAGDIIEVQFSGTAPVYITQEVQSHISSLPAIVIVIDDFPEFKQQRESRKLREYLGDHSLIGFRDAPKKRQFSVSVNCIGPHDLPTIALANSVSRIFSEYYLEENDLRTLASGERVEIINWSPTVSRDDGDLQVFRKITSFTGDVWDWSETDYTTVPLIETIQLDVGTIFDYLETLEVT